MRIVDINEMREIEKLAEGEYGFTESLVVENVGIKGSQLLQSKYLKDHYFGELTVFVGKGNNGADGLAIARHLRSYGHRVRACMLFPQEEWSQELKVQQAMAEKFGVKTTEMHSAEQLLAYFTQAQEDFFVIDAIFGTGVRLPVSNFLRDIMNLINQYSSFTVAIDIPTGVMGDTGSYQGSAVQANVTLAIGLPKVGHYVSHGPQFLGEICILDAGFPEELLRGGDKTLLTAHNVGRVINYRSDFAHKNTFGHTLIIGGSTGLTGALILASRAALTVGCGLVTAVTWEQNYQELTSRIQPEIMTAPIPQNETKALALLENLSHYDAIVIGPGIGRTDLARRLVLKVLDSYSGPVVIDADAINVLNLKEDAARMQSRTAFTLLTPHLGEFARLTGESVEEVQEKPLQFIHKLIEETSCTVLLKGPCTYLGFPNGDVFINYFPNEGLATGGSGDVLAGILGGLFAQRTSQKRYGVKVEEEQLYGGVCLGAVVHSLAGKHAADKLGKRSMYSGSIVDFLARAFLDIEKSENNLREDDTI